ncbi:MAG: GntR family transcriptional regulator [Halanaerobiales bacterium]
MTLINKDKRPLYLRIKEYIEEKINEGKYNPGDKLPSENKLSDQLDVSRASLREALRVLEEEGKIVKHQGIGTFVNKPKPKFKKGIEKLNSVTETIEKDGYEAGTENLKIKVIKLSESLKEKFFTTIGDEIKEVLRIERVRTANDTPVVYCLDHLLLKYIDNNYKEEYFRNSLFETLKNNYNIEVRQAVTNISSVVADKYIADYLKINKGDPLLLLEQYHYDDEHRMILFSQNYFRNDQFQFKVLRKR